MRQHRSKNEDKAENNTSTWSSSVNEHETHDALSKTRPTISNRLQDTTVQPKLEISDPDDKYEREADRVAEQVMNMDDPTSNRQGLETSKKGSPPGIQRMCSRCQKRHREGKPLNCSECEEEFQRKTEAKGIMAEGGQGKAAEMADETGKPLSDRTRSFFENRMGRDFSDVRVHEGSKADEAARSINARAFTLGRDIVFRSGEFRPQTQSGKRLLAHELTHVVQQNGGHTASPSRSTSNSDSPNQPTADVNIHGSDAEHLQRWSLGEKGLLIAPPVDEDYVEVPADEEDRVKAAMNIIERIASSPDHYPRCHDAFNQERSNNLLQRIVNVVRIWKEPVEEGEDGLLGSHTSYDISIGGRTYDIAYTEGSYKMGRWTIAATLLHEMAHIAGIGHDDDPNNEAVVDLCGLPTTTEL